MWSPFTILVLCLIFSIVFFYIGFSIDDTIKKEGFDIQDLNQEVVTLYKMFEDKLCPGLLYMEEELVKDPMNQGRNRSILMQKEMGSRPMYCPGPTNAIDLPADIGIRIKKSLTFLETKTAEILKQIGSSLTQCADGSTKEPVTNESFLTESFITKEDEDSEPKIDPVEEAAKESILEQRKKQLELLSKDTQFLQQMEELQPKLKKLVEYSQKAKAGTLKPSCS